MTEPVLVYDDDCGFCTWWADLIDERSDLRIVGFSDLEDEDPSLLERLPNDYESCSHLVTDEGVYSCGASIEEALVRTDLGSRARPAVDRLRDVGAYGSAREWTYRRIADNRAFWGKLLSKTPPAREGDSRPKADDAR
ncbi:DCC1-like thiol-disulfide oxidoreductase family protein [Natrialbaceae archaeon GCM10025810]|uniref:DCC1-like thiol-disulfide oxidoreductase family protein n=1 Tax=Halovalidus salilacus TaxID=3075124 RepID=UPI003618214C